MQENLNKEEKKNSEGWKKKFVVGIVLIFTILFVLLIILTLNDTSKEKKVDSSNSLENIVVDNHYNYDYEYVLQTFFGCDTFIYLLKDGTVKVVSKTPIHEVCSEFNCMKDTGKFNYEENTLSFSEKSMEKVKKFIVSFFEKKSTNYVNLEKIELTEEQQRVELAILLDSEDMITFADDLNFETKTQQMKNSSGKIIFENSKTTIANSNNKIVQVIGTYLNEIVEEEWKKLLLECNEMMANGIQVDDQEKLGVQYSITIEHIGAFSVSFRYSMQGKMGGVPWIDEKGFVFNSANGEIKEFSGGNKTKTFNDAVATFEKSQDYKDNKEKLKSNWKEILKEEMFSTGNWYLKENKIVFVIPENLIVEDGNNWHILEMEVDATDINF